MSLSTAVASPIKEMTSLMEAMDGTLFIRTGNELYCIRNTKKGN